MRILIITSKAVSLTNVARDIAYVAQKLGHVPRLTRIMPLTTEVSRVADAVIFVYPASPLFCTSYFAKFREYRVHAGVPCVFYTTLEGRLTTYLVKTWMRRDLEFVANSNYTAHWLREAGLQVLGVVHHGIVREQVEVAKKMVHVARKNLEKVHGDKVIFGALAFWHKRKGLDYLAKAIKVLSEKRKDFVVHLVTNSQTMKYIGSIEGLYVDTVFGTRSREEILAFLGALDWLIIPSLAEGFCLPLLEANAMGTPAIHCLYQPLTEISDVDANIPFPYDEVVLEDLGEGFDYEMHRYDPKILAKAMEEAIEIRLHDERDYRQRCERVRRVLDRFDAEKLYPQLLKYLGA